ncbi:MAG: hypothetical protein ABI605_14375 [Rhizobacter sp.]
MCNCVKKTTTAPAVVSMLPTLPQFPLNLAARERTVFEYVGATALMVVGPATGRCYRFDRPGAMLAVDLRDRATLAGIRSLRMQQAA